MHPALLWPLRAALRALCALCAGATPEIPVNLLVVAGRSARLYAPPGSEDRPAVVHFHGGGFIACDLDTHDAVCRRLATAAGLRVLAVDYRLAPEAPAPAQADDALAACAWLQQHPGLLDQHRLGLFLSGDSAGAWLALHCRTAFAGSAARVRGLLLFYPYLRMDDAGWRRPLLGSGRWAGRLASWLIRCCLVTPYPAHAVEAVGMPPVAMISGKPLDPVFPDGEAWAAQLRRQGVPVEHVVFPWLLHGGINLAGISRSGRAAMAVGGAILKRWSDAPF